MQPQPPFPVDRAHPPKRIVYREARRSLELRPWSFEDIDPILGAVSASVAELRAFMPWAHAPLTRESEYEVIRLFQADYWAGRQYAFGVFDDRGAILGGLGLHPRMPLNPRGLEIGYWCRTSEAGKGWTTLAVRVLAAFAFRYFECDRLQVTHDEENVASRRVVEKCGFVFEGTVRNLIAEPTPPMRAAGFRGGVRHRLYGLTRDDLPTLDWMPAIRAGTIVYDALGERVASDEDLEAR